MPESREAVLKEINKAISMLSWGYYVWFFIYVVMVILTVGLPGVAALLSDPLSRYFAGCAAIVAAVSHALKPHEYATGFDVGLQLAWKTRISFVAGGINAADAAKDIRRAIDLTTFRYAATRNQ
jgi:hypothetical protein